MVNQILASVFSDDLFTATDLNRRAGYVLDRAIEHPVTITRNEQAFALLRREEMSNLTATTQQMKTLLEIFNVAYRLDRGRDIGLEHPYSWVKAFDSEELNELIIELLDAYRCGIDTGNWNFLNATIHEWKESAIAINSQELAVAFSEQSEEIPITKPNLD
ncbi:MAG: hypothetical protein ACRC2R_20025 [Xenococcaceae cyanobacterium]